MIKVLELPVDRWDMIMEFWLEEKMKMEYVQVTTVEIIVEVQTQLFKDQKLFVKELNLKLKNAPVKFKIAVTMIKMLLLNVKVQEIHQENHKRAINKTSLHHN